MRFVVLTIASLVASPVFAQAYKCPAQDGTVAYQDKPCAGGVQVVAAPQPKVEVLTETPVPADTADPGAIACRANAFHYFKDPDSVKVEPDVTALVSKGKPSTVFRRWLIAVNAKNSYGGYVGTKPYLCVTSLDGKIVMSVVPWN